MPPPRGGQLAIGLQDASHHHGHDPIALGRGARPDEVGEAQPPHGLQHRLHVSMVERGEGLEGVRRVDELLALEHPAHRFHGFWGELGEVGQGAGLDLAVFAVALAQQDGGG